ncbi:glycosyltransferase family 4 protein [Patescibacteria group bacterium]|nr:glycosyltransferase family 4 protein [Patescibacteria group bacterium]
MNILILNWKDIKNPEKGGAEVIAFELARRLIKAGHNVYFFTRIFPGCLKEETIDGVRIIRRGGKLSVYFYAYLYYRNSKIKFDRVIDMINTIAWQTPLYVPKSKRIGYLNQLAREVFFHELPRPLSNLAFLLEGFQYLSYKKTQFLCYSNSTKQDLVSLGISEKKISLFPIGIDHARYVKKGEKSRYPLFVFVGRIGKMKRVDVCVKAMGKVAKKYSASKLFIIGNGPEEDRLETLVKSLRISENISFINKNNFFIDKVKKDIKVELMQRAWALLLPSVKEGWGLVVTEAGICGTPSIVSNVTGLKDSVVGEKTGIILSEYPTEMELSSAMIRIIEDEKLREKLSKEAILYAKTFTWDRCYREFERHLFQRGI